MQNTNAQTGIRYGVTSHAELLIQEIFDCGDSISYKAWKVETIRDLTAQLDDEDTTAESLANAIDEMGGESSDEDIAYAIAREDGTNEQLAAYLVDNAEWDGVNFEEEEFEYTDSDGNEFLLQYLGGAPLVWCVKTSEIVHVKSLCSPCVPNAGDLDSGLTTEGYQCYGVPNSYKV